jgi:hypothetical protein
MGEASGFLARTIMVGLLQRGMVGVTRTDIIHTTEMGAEVEVVEAGPIADYPLKIRSDAALWAYIHAVPMCSSLSFAKCDGHPCEHSMLPTSCLCLLISY